MIDIFKSGSGKKIIAISDNSGILATDTPGGVLLVGTDEAISQLRIALNSERDGWDKEAIKACKFKLPKLTSEQKAEIIELYESGTEPRDIPLLLGLNPNQVNGVIHGHRFPVQANIAKKAAKEKSPMSESDKRQSIIDKIIADGRKAGHGFVRIADDINREVGGNWLPNDVHRRIMEMEG